MAVEAKKATEQTKAPVFKEHSDKGKKILIGLMAVVLATMPALGVWYWQQSEADQAAKVSQAKIDSLTKQNQELQKKNAALLKLSNAEKKVEAVCANLTATQIENIHASIESMNTAALDGLMTDNVEFVVAASEKGGSETKALAIADLDYLNSATMPWNWAINAATLNAYKAGDYKTYVADDTIFGVAANKYFVSMRVTCGKIDQIFVAASSDLL